MIVNSIAPLWTCCHNERAIAEWRSDTSVIKWQDCKCYEVQHIAYLLKFTTNEDMKNAWLSAGTVQMAR